jgi:predicted metalloprotease with PDZ domain
MTQSPSRAALLVAFTALALVSGRAAQAQSPATLHVAVDARQAPQKIYHVKVTMPAAAGPFTFVYPEWIPGYHGPVGPIEGVVSLRVLAGGKTLEWRRDLVDMYAVHTDVPAGAGALEVDFDVVGAPSHNGQIEPVSDAQIALVEFSNMIVYPQGATAETTPVEASLTLPAGWTFGTALPVASHAGDTIAFAPSTLYTLVDSPVIAGAHEKAFPLGGEHELDVAADSAGALDATPHFLTGMKHLVEEAPALYGGKHYRDYHFLLTLSDEIDIEGIEHHESSDNRAPEKYISDDDTYKLLADLMPHEYSHSWNGKYRRPADLATPDYQAPEKTDLLWVYEGLNQYNGEKLATRARLNSFHEELEILALQAANMDVQSGRAWRPVRDTADGAPFLYQAPSQYYEIRRSGGDFYSEGDLIWLDADVTIRRLTHGAKSLDDFCKLWGDGTDQHDVPVFRGYTESDVYALLNQVAPYDWAGFFKARIATIQPRADLDGITGGGYKLVYDGTPSDLFKGQESDGKVVDERFSIGFSVATGGEGEGTVRDILTQSPAFAAGLAPGMRIVAVDGRRFSADVLHDAVRAHKGRTEPLQLIVENGGFFKVVSFAAPDGERYPHLVRTGEPDVLEQVYHPKTFAPPAEKAPT